MMYGVFCKTEYFNTWPLMLKEELAGFATVEVVAPAKIKTIPDEIDYIISPSGNFSTTFLYPDDIGDDEFCVYVVSDGGYLYMWGCFTQNKTNLHIVINDFHIANKQIYREMYDRTTKVLNKLDEKN